MLVKLLMAGGLVSATVGIHAAGFAALLWTIVWSGVLNRSGLWLVTRWLIGLACWLIAIHGAEIAVWALFYLWQGSVPDAEAAFYFSGVTYTTVGYGDIILPKPWRLLAPLEALTGTLMFGLSTGLFFGLVSRWTRNQMRLQGVFESDLT
jgi:voltage-gated potassium channel Kch